MAGSRSTLDSSFNTLLTSSVLSQMCFGKSYALDDPRVKEWMQMNDEFNSKFGLSLAADYFSWAKYVPSSGPRLMKDLMNDFINFIKSELAQHKQQAYDPDNISDFYSMLLKAQEDAKREGENVEKLTDVHIMQTLLDIFTGDYVIPKGAIVIVNLHSMHFDPQEWDDPDSFKPEHFLDEAGTVRQHPPGFMPFGAGRRSCLGEAVAKADLFLIFSWFLQNYTFSKVPGKESENLINIIPKTAAGRLLTPYEIVIKERK
ncbi:steroid 17-alpha-hydroxylase/17,20 lyase-like [Diadema antillarum]|uniref:steroid 17-alpha-hydroxylase/17,20 lyase-like n=1 Tax=Diadema antillarum TaxID=105358 RepID=UPI003A897CDE